MVEGLDLAVDGDVIYARGTTLGGDDGIAVAMLLAVLDGAAPEHPPIEAVFTVDEEIGLLGAAALDGGVLAKFDADGEYLDEDLDGTFEDWSMPEEFNVLDGM